MFEVQTDLNLPLKLLLNATFNELRLVEHFQSYYKFALPLPRKVDMPKFTTAKRFAYFEVVDCPFLGVESLPWLRFSLKCYARLMKLLTQILTSLVRTNF